jgi:hypothetical protein
VSKFWRALTVAAVAVGVVAGSGLPAVAATAGPAITLAAKSSFAPVTGDVYVVFDTATYDKATISGSITGAASGDVAKLFAQPFPYNRAAAAVGSVTLTGATQSYAFSVKPTVATRYQVELFASATSATALAVSGSHKVYVIGGGKATGVKACARPTCRETIHLQFVVPASALKREMGKHLYFYFGLSLAAKKAPKLPKWVTLDTHATVAKAKKLGAKRFGLTIGFSFRVGNDGYYWTWASCLKDTESADGIGLPGHHSCGAKRVRSTVAYLG